VARIIFSYRLIRLQDNALLAEGETGHAFTNTSGKPINLMKTHRDLYEKLYNIYQEQSDSIPLNKIEKNSQ